jgi:hypothetical protein
LVPTGQQFWHQKPTDVSGGARDQYLSYLWLALGWQIVAKKIFVLTILLIHITAYRSLLKQRKL